MLNKYPGVPFSRIPPVNTFGNNIFSNALRAGTYNEYKVLREYKSVQNFKLEFKDDFAEYLI